MRKKRQPYGLWPSSLTPELVAAKQPQLSQLKVQDPWIYWLETRPLEGGRQVSLRMSYLANSSSTPECLTPPGFNVRSRVHEYGGGDYWLATDAVYFVSDADQRIYRQSSSPPYQPVVITPEPPSPKAWRYADGVVTQDGCWIICIQEVHHADGVDNQLVLIPTDGHQSPRVLVSGADFYLNPRLSPNNQQLAWISWNQPNMPWDGNQLWLADFSAECGVVTSAIPLAGGLNESIGQLEWGEDAALYLIDDRTGWWNLYRWRLGEQQTEPLAPMARECGFPQWGFCAKNYALLPDGRVILLALEQGICHLLQVDNHSQQPTSLPLPYTAFGDYGVAIDSVGQGIAFIAAHPKAAPAVVYYDVMTQTTRVLSATSSLLTEADISVGEMIAYPGYQERTAYGFYYAPCHSAYMGPIDSRPPLLVMLHGGPTAQTQNGLRHKIQFWTTRGFAVWDVNYSGSTGFGRAYRQRLLGEWGVADVADCLAGVRYLIQQGWVNPQQIAITGGSAGGFTVLRALTTSHLFSAGACYYGVADLTLLLQDTHKFEGDYLEKLIGPYSLVPERYVERSPLYALNQLQAPLIIFQGLEDKVVPPSQSLAIVEALQARQLYYEYVTYPHEQHGFRDAATIADALQREYQFYLRVWQSDFSNTP